jgi:hypothetical protein
MLNITAMTIDRAARHSLTACQARRSGLRKNSIAIFMMLLVEYGLGMGVNLYARVPAADQRRPGRHGTGPGPDQPVLLAIHATLGLLILVAGVGVHPRRPRPGSPGDRRLGGRPGRHHCRSDQRSHVRQQQAGRCVRGDGRPHRCGSAVLPGHQADGRRAHRTDPRRTG